MMLGLLRPEPPRARDFSAAPAAPATARPTTGRQGARPTSAGTCVAPSPGASSGGRGPLPAEPPPRAARSRACSAGRGGSAERAPSADTACSAHGEGQGDGHASARRCGAAAGDWQESNQEPWHACGSGLGAAAACRSWEHSASALGRSKSSNGIWIQMDTEKAFMEDLFENFRVRLRQGLRQDLVEVISDTRGAWAAEAGQQLRRDLESAAAELKAEASSLREHLSQSIGQASAELRAERRQLQLAAQQARTQPQAVEVDVTPIMDQIRQMGERADVDLSAVLQGVREAERGLAALRQAELPEPKRQVPEGHGEQELAALQQEVRELRQTFPQLQADLSGVLSAVKELARPQAPQVDVSQLQEEIRELRQQQIQVDLSPVLKVIQDWEILPTLRDLREGVAGCARELAGLGPAVRADRAELLRALGDGRHHSSQQEADLSTMHDMLKKLVDQVTPVDFSPFQKELRQLRMQLEVDFASLNKAVRERLTESSLEHAAELEHQRRYAGVEFGQILEEIRSVRTRVDVAPVLQAIREHRPTVDLSPVLQAIRESKTVTDLSPVLQAIRESKTVTDLSPVVQAIRESKTVVDFSPVLQAIRESRSAADVSPVLNIIREHQPVVDFSPVLKAIRESKTVVDFSPVLQAIHESRTAIDFSPVFKNITENKPVVDFSPLLQAIRESKTVVDFSPVLQAIHQSRSAIDFSPVLKSISENKPVVDFSPVLQAIRESKAVTDFSLVLRAISEIKAAMDFSPILKAIGENKPVVDFFPVLEAVREVLAAIHVARATGESRQHPVQAEVDLSPVLSLLLEIQKKVELLPSVRDLSHIRTQFEVDLSSLTKAVREWLTDSGLARAEQRSRDGGVELMQVMEEIGRLRTAVNLHSESKAVVDFSPVLQAIRESKPVVDFSIVLKAIHDSQSDLSPVLRAIKESRTVVDLSPVLEAIRESRAAADYAPILRAIAESRLAVDFAPVLREVRDSKAAVDFAPVLEALGKVDLAPVLREIRDLKLQRPEGLDQLPAALGGLREGVAELRRGLTELLARPAAGKHAELLGMGEEKRPQLDLILQEVADIKRHELLTRDELSALFATIRHMRPEVDLSPVLTELQHLKQHMPQVDLSPVLTELQHLKQHIPQVDQVALLQQIQECRQTVDHSQMPTTISRPHLDLILQEVADIKRLELLSRDDLSALFATIRHMRPEGCTQPVDLSQAPTAISRIAADLSKVIPAIENSSSLLLKAFHEMPHQTAVDLPAIVNAVKGIKMDVDLGPIIAEVRKLKPQSEAKVAVDVDFSPVLKEIRQIPSARDLDLSPVIKAVREWRAEADFASLFREVRQLQARPDVDLSPVLREVRQLQSVLESRSAVDLGALVTEVRQLQHRPGVDLTPILEAIRENRTEVDLAPVWMAIQHISPQIAELVQASRAGVDFSEVLGQLGEMYGEAALRTSKVGVDIVPVMEQVRQLKHKLDVEQDRIEMALAPLSSSLSHISLQMAEILQASRSGVDFGAAFGQAREMCGQLEAAIRAIEGNLDNQVMPVVCRNVRSW